MSAERRHVLVIASQCDAMQQLKHLESAARELARALTSQGGCEPGLPGRQDAWVYGALTVPEIQGHVVEAAEYAEREGAVLVLALLGHGFTPGASSAHLYFMGKESQPHKILKAYNVPEAIQKLADYPALPGVVVIVDTCAAAGAVPPADALTAGAKNGGKRLTMLVGCSVLGEGIAMMVSRKLAAIVRSGMPGRGPYLTSADIKARLQDLVPAQDIGRLDWDSMPGSPPLGMVRNAAWSDRYIPAADGSQLHAILVGLFGDPYALPHQWDPSAITDWRRRLGELPSTMEKKFALQLLADLDVANKTNQMVHTWLGSDLTTSAICRALELIDRPPHTLSISLAEALASIADAGYPQADPGCEYVLARLVAALGWVAGADLDAPEIHAWAIAVGVAQQLNDAVAGFRALDLEANQPRLIVSLASFTDWWPEEVTAYVLHGSEQGSEPPIHRVFPCPARTEDATAEALVAAVRWGRDRAQAIGGRLNRVDVAAREHVLLTWRPELVEVGTRLGVGFDVRLRWSEQITPPDDIWRVNDVARACLEEMAGHFGSPPLVWLTRRLVDDGKLLQSRFIDGKYQHKALSLDHQPTDPALFRLLKSHSAVVLWPGDARRLPPGTKQQMRQCWHRLPESMREAFRAELRDERGEVPGRLRTVWDDLAWLDFCDTITPLQLD